MGEQCDYCRLFVDDANDLTPVWIGDLTEIAMQVCGICEDELRSQGGDASE